MKKILIAAAVVVIALIAGMIALSASQLSIEDKLARCPEVTRNLISSRIGEPTSFKTTEGSAYDVQGEAVVNGTTYWWGCGPGITKGNRVDVDVREGNSTVIGEYVDL